MVTEIVEKKVATKEDIFIKARMISEGLCFPNQENLSPELSKMKIQGERKPNELKIPEKLDLNDPESIIELLSEVKKTNYFFQLFA
ncbi:hypothetical protein LCGC14_1965820 [marine sediment metagenome]|uniref:Uncharacterized protein n=1 Tax=marine sediment metagenome TaxID=412755 RepID=A0A0F9HRN3_9ZZZZ